MKKVLIVTSHYPPVKSGLSDYCKTLEKHLIKKVKLETFFLENINKQWSSLRTLELMFRIRRDKVDSVLIEYVPYMYGKRGICPVFVIVILLLRLLTNSKLVLYVHEIHHPDNGDIKSKTLSIIHKLQILVLSKVVHVLAATTERFKNEVEHITKKETIKIPIGSNIEIGNKVFQTDFNNAVIIFGGFHTSKMFENIYKALSTEDIKLIHIGMSRDDVPIDLVQYINSNTMFIGYVSEEKVSSILKSGFPILTPFIDGASTRRGTMIAALEHGARVYSTKSKNTDNELCDVQNLTLYNVNEFIDKLLSDIESISKRKPLNNSVKLFSWETITKSIVNIL